MQRGSAGLALFYKERSSKSDELASGRIYGIAQSAAQRCVGVRLRRGQPRASEREDGLLNADEQWARSVSGKPTHQGRPFRSSDGSGKGGRRVYRPYRHSVRTEVGRIVSASTSTE